MTGHVQDVWTSPGANGRRVHNDRWGKGKRWQARWVESGTEKSKTFASKDAAEKHLALVEVHGPFIPRPRVTFHEYAETWRLSRLGHRPSTAESVENIFRLMLLPELGRLPLVDVTRQDVQNAVIAWSSRYSIARVHIGYGYVATLYKEAMLDGIVKATPCTRIELPEKVKKRIQPLTNEQVVQIADNVSPWWRIAVIVAAATGLRISELGGLTYDRVRAGLVTVDRQLTDYVAGQPHYGPPKSKAGFRDVQMGTVAWEQLREHLRLHPDNPHGLVFMNRQGGPLHRMAASNAWRGATKGMALRPRSGWHDLRHYHASALIAAGLSPRAVADRLGHADVAETLGTYSHLWPNDEQRSVAAIDAALAGLRDASASPPATPPDAPDQQ